MNMEVSRLEIAEKLSRMQAYDDSPFKMKPVGIFSPELRPRKSTSKTEEEEQLKKAKEQLTTETNKYRDLLKKKHAADADNLKNYLSVHRSKDKAVSLKEECRTLQTKNKERAKAGKESVEAIKAKTAELKDSVTKSVESISENIEKDEKTLEEKEKEWAELNDSLHKARKHRELQLKQKEAIENAMKLQAQIGDAKGAQRAHAMSQLETKRELQKQRLAEKEKKHKEYEQLLLSLSERNETVKGHLKENLPVYHGYLEKEGLLRKQLELLKQREATAMSSVKIAEARAIQSALEPDQVAKVKALNASKAKKCNDIRDQIKASAGGAKSAGGSGSSSGSNHSGTGAGAGAGAGTGLANDEKENSSSSGSV